MFAGVMLLTPCVRAQALVDIVKHGLVDENQKVKTITALTVSALAEAASPYGIESFDDVLEPLWKGIRLLRGKVRGAVMLHQPSLRILLVSPAAMCVDAGHVCTW